MSINGDWITPDNLSYNGHIITAGQLYVEDGELHFIADRKVLQRQIVDSTGVILQPEILESVEDCAKRCWRASI